MSRPSIFARPGLSWARHSWILIAALLTLVLAARTLWYLFSSVSNVPYQDQWVLLEDIRHAGSGQSGWSYLWSPYWGQRMLLPRLLFLLSARYLHFSTLPFIVVNTAVQTSLAIVLIAAVRRIFDHKNARFWVAAVAVFHLLFSSLQMETLIQDVGIQYTIGYASATSAICILGATLHSSAAFERRFWIAIFLGIASTACLAIGLLLWPILLFEAWLAAAHRKHHLTILAALAILLPVAYAIGYSRPQMGMGPGGVVRHPISALSIVALVLGGPVSIYDRTLGAIAGAIGIAIACSTWIYLWRKRCRTAGLLSLCLVALLMLGSAASLAVGRYTPEWLANYKAQPLPSRYLAPTFVFWAALFPVSLSLWNRGRLARIGSIAVSILVAILTFGTWNWQVRVAREWAIYFQSFDAIGSGFLVSASDQEFMSRLFLDESRRNSLVDYLRAGHLSIFAEPRAGWLGRDIQTIAPLNNNAHCQAILASPVFLAGNTPAFRINGTITVNSSPRPRRLDILITDGAGIVQGLARTLPAQSEGKPGTDFFGYTRAGGGRGFPASRMFIMLPEHCTCAAQIRQGIN